MHPFPFRGRNSNIVISSRIGHILPRGGALRQRQTMTDQIMSDKLIDYFSRLDREGHSAMANIIDLTAPHLNGIAFSILTSDVKCSRVLKTIYAKIWANRHTPIQSEDPLNALRAITHRYALHVKHFGLSDLTRDDLMELYTPCSPLSFKVSSLSGTNLSILKEKYLSGASEVLNKVNNEDRQKLNEIASNLNRGKS